MRTRKNQANLSQPDRKAFVDAVIALKNAGIYDEFVRQHRDVFENPKNPAHSGPGFLPWHREFLLRFEIALQGINANVSLPYWDWTVDNSKASSLWDREFMGGDGSGQDLRVGTGSFAYDNGWQLTTLPKNPSEDPQGSDPFLKRKLGSPESLPTPDTVMRVLNFVPYDRKPWHNYDTGSFRAELETLVHDRVHGWVGPSMSSACAPNDPVFWLHHCNVDRLWAQWQSSHLGWPYLPPSGTPDVWPGHGLDDPMMPERSVNLPPPTPHGVLNHHALGYQYDTEQPRQPYAAVSWQMGSYWRVYGCGTDRTVYEERYDDGQLNEWTAIETGDYVAAVTWPGAGQPANQPIRIYTIMRPIDGSQAIQEYSSTGNGVWTNTKTWPLPVPATSIAAVSWGNGSHIRVYFGVGQTIRQLCWDGGLAWTEGVVIPGATLISAYSWEDGSGVEIRVHAIGPNSQIGVWASSDGVGYNWHQLP